MPRLMGRAVCGNRCSRKNRSERWVYLFQACATCTTDAAMLARVRFTRQSFHASRGILSGLFWEEVGVHWTRNQICQTKKPLISQGLHFLILGGRGDITFKDWTNGADIRRHRPFPLRPTLFRSYRPIEFAQWAHTNYRSIILSKPLSDTVYISVLKPFANGGSGTRGGVRNAQLPATAVRLLPLRRTHGACPSRKRKSFFANLFPS